MSAAQRFLTQRIIPLKEKKSRAEVEREVDGVRKEKERLTASKLNVKKTFYKAWNLHLMSKDLQKDVETKEASITGKRL